MGGIEVIHIADREISEADATSGMVRECAIDDPGVWMGVVRTASRQPSGWHHHGDYDTYFYVQEGRIRLEFGPEGSRTVEATPGDFVHVPKHLVHRESNPAEQMGSIVLTRVGSGPPVINVDGPEQAGSVR